jgi:hypothetical protein
MAFLKLGVIERCPPAGVYGLTSGKPRSVRSTKIDASNLKPNPASTAIWVKKLGPNVPPSWCGLAFQMLPASANKAPYTMLKSFWRNSILASSFISPLWSAIKVLPLALVGSTVPGPIDLALKPLKLFGPPIKNCWLYGKMVELPYGKPTPAIKPCGYFTARAKFMEKAYLTFCLNILVKRCTKQGFLACRQVYLPHL